jgi:hypothetical protein
MYLCYIDESGTPDVPGNTSHYVLAGISIPVEFWRDCDKAIEVIKAGYDLSDEEIHVAWMLRSYPEQNKIIGFDRMDYAQRRHEVTAFRATELLRLQRSKNPALLRQTKKNYAKTACYVHLTTAERRELIREMAGALSGWGFARLFAECVDKLYFDPARMGKTIDEQAFDQIVSRFETFLQATGQGNAQPNFGLLIHDNNETVAKKHTQLMKKFHHSGTLWVNVQNIIETPLFVNSQLTSMVQMADLCGYALRRYLENQEDELFDLVFTRADRRVNTVVGVRHFTNLTCTCKICTAHRQSARRL